MRTDIDRRASRILRQCACACACVAWSGSIAASQVQSPPAAPVMPPSSTESWETQSVRELMQRDLQDALRESSPTASGRRADRAPRPMLAPRLVALYGVGQALMAEIQVGQRAYLYVRGQPFPAGHAGDSGVYQLKGMNGACVQLERGEDRHSLCLRMLLGGDRP